MSKGLTVTALLLIAGMMYLAGTQGWVLAELAGESTEVSGQDAQPAVVALAAVAAAAALFMSLARTIGRWVSAAVLVLAGAGYIASALQVVSAPQNAGRAVLSEATGLVQSAETAALTAWPWIGMAAAILLIVLAVLAAVAGRRWGGAGRRFERQDARAPRTVSSTADEAAESWDALSRGEDPSEER